MRSKSSSASSQRHETLGTRVASLTARNGAADLAVRDDVIAVRVVEAEIVVAGQVLTRDGVDAREAIADEHGVETRDADRAVHVALGDRRVVAGDGQVALDDAVEELRVVLVDGDVALDAD